MVKRTFFVLWIVLFCLFVWTTDRSFGEEKLKVYISADMEGYKLFRALIGLAY